MKKLFLSMAFVGLGTFAMAQQTQPTMKADRGGHGQNMEMRQQKQLDNLKAELNLTDAQVSQIKAVQQKNMAERKANMSNNNSATMSKADRKDVKMEKRNNMQDEMKQILTPNQYTKWELHMKQKLEKYKERKMEMKSDKMQKKDDVTTMQKMETK